MAHFVSCTLKLVHCLPDDVVHLVRGARSIHVVVSLEKVPRQIARREWTTGLVERGASPVDSLGNQTLLHS